MDEEEDQGPRLLKHLFGEMDTLQAHADVLDRKNKILSDQKVNYERTVDRLRSELSNKEKARTDHRYRVQYFS